MPPFPAKYPKAKLKNHGKITVRIKPKKWQSFGKGKMHVLTILMIHNSK